MEQKLLLLCKEKISKIVTILGAQNSDEVTEFQTTVQMVQVVVNRLLNGKKEIKIDVPLLDRINVILGEYLDILEQFVQSGRLKRLLTSNRIRRRLEKINSDLHAQLKLFVDSLKKLNTGENAADMPSKIVPPKKEPAKKEKKKEKTEKKKEKKAKKVKKTSTIKEKKASTRTPAVKKNDVPSPKKEEPEKERERTKSETVKLEPSKEEKETETKHSDQEDEPLDIIKDVEGKAFWEKLFGHENFYVEWDKFISSLAQVLKIEIGPDETTLLKHVLDNSATGHVNMYKWSEFLKGFGPIPDIIKNVQETLFAPWFHGFLSSKEAELLLEDQPVGTYLIRFSRSSGGSFALAFVQEPKKILHILIQSAQPEGFRMEEEEDSQARVFKSLKDIVQHYSMHLITPFTSDLPRESWFHGDVSAQEAQELLAPEKEGTYLIRFSSRSGCFAASYKGDGEIKHALIQAVDGGYLFAGEQEIFPDLKTLLCAYATTLQHPLPNVENNVAPVLSKYWASKALEKNNQPIVLTQDSHYESVRNHVDKGK